MTYHANARQAAEEENAQAVLQTITFLRNAAVLLCHRTFRSWFKNDKARFECSGSALASKLRKDLMLQVNQAMPSDHAGADDFKKFDALAVLCTTQADLLAVKSQQTKAKGKQGMTLPRSRLDAEKAIYSILSDCNWFALKRTNNLPGEFYVWNALSSIITYARSRDTLANGTGNNAFDTMLSGLDENYLVSGYPHDLLCHDAATVRSGEAPYAIMLNPDYCSTYAVSSESEMVGHANLIAIRLQHSAVAA
ncbi:MAG: hypothetical protein V7693_16060 [Halopseudomonas sabulinigri]